MKKNTSQSSSSKRKRGRDSKKLKKLNPKDDQRDANTSTSISNNAESSNLNAQAEVESLLLSESSPKVEQYPENLDLPPWYRFCPLDHELILFYLWNKIRKRPCPVEQIFRFDELYFCDPPSLPFEDFERGTGTEVYYFMKVQDLHRRRVIVIREKDGEWVRYGDEEPVYYGNVVVGFKKNRIFRWKIPVPEVFGGTEWVVNELRLNIEVVPQHVLHDYLRRQVEKWVVCRIMKIVPE